MENKSPQPTNAEIKADLQLQNTRYAIDIFCHGCSLYYNYNEIQSLNADIDQLYDDLERLVWYVRGRYIYSLPVSQDEINTAHQIRTLISQKQAQKNDTRNKMIVSGIFAAFSLGALILKNSNK